MKYTMKNVFHYLLILLVLSCVDVFSQSSIPPIAQTPDVLPPSPTAGELGKYGLVPVGLSTGTPNISIPINNFSTKNLSVPISLSYNSNGIKVDQLASWVGMGWSLNCGGVITRVVRDNPDELTPSSFSYPENFNSTNIIALSYLEEAGLRGDALDTEKDLYSFNFVGNTGKFVFDHNGAPVIMPYQNLHIQWVETSSITGYFVVTTPDGVKYTFDEVEVSSTTGGPSSQNGYNYIQTSWYLSKIEHPLGDVIDLSYKDKDYQYAFTISQTITRKLNEVYCGSQLHCPEVDDQTTPIGIHAFGKHISKIEADGYGSLEFISSLNRTDLDDYELDDILVKDFNGQTMKSYSFNYSFTPGRMFLDSFSEEGISGVKVKNYSFDYEDKSGLPSRLSYNQDHWGYYNGADNDYFVPKEMNYASNHVFVGIGGDREPNSTYSKKGVLKKITYPTGGWSAFDWEANTIYGDKTIYPTPTPKNLTCNGNFSGPVTKQIEITSPMDQTIEYSFSASLLPGQQNPGPSIGAQLNIWDITDNKFIRGLDLELGENHLNYLNLTSGHTYRFQLIAEAEPVSSYLSFDYYQTAAQT
ncbi:MAG: hypothetical protein KTR26_07840, partial [Flammeovirgaceae bacterium]|nr:hypothetical protein [Flammeovirgaceae bacterium]